MLEDSYYLSTLILVGNVLLLGSEFFVVVLNLNVLLLISESSAR